MHYGEKMLTKFNTKSEFLKKHVKCNNIWELKDLYAHAHNNIYFERKDHFVGSDIRKVEDCSTAINVLLNTHSTTTC